MAKYEKVNMTAEQFAKFREEMRRLRAANGLSGQALADLVGCTAVHISSIERGYRNPSKALAENIAGLFNMTVAEMCGAEDKHEAAAEADIEIMRKFGAKYRTKRLERGFTRTEVAGFAGITKECLIDFEEGRCSLGESVLEKLNRLYTVKKEVETVEVVKEVVAESPISLDLIDAILGHLAEICIGKDEKLDMFRRLSEVRTSILEKQIFG